MQELSKMTSHLKVQMSFVCSKYNLPYQIYFHKENVPRDTPVT